MDRVRDRADVGDLGAELALRAAARSAPADDHRTQRPGAGLFGLLGYALLFISACLPGQRARTAGMVFTVFAIAMSTVLTYLELNVIHAICYWCVASAVCATCHVVVNSIRYGRGEPQLAYAGAAAVR